MHRTVPAAILGAVLLSVSGCTGEVGDTSGSGPTAVGATLTAAESTVVTAEPSPAEPIEHTADTERICRRLDALFEGDELERFAKELGRLIRYRREHQTAKTKAAQLGAQRELHNLAAAVRRGTAAAKDPQLTAAGRESAAGIEKSAADDTFFTKLRTIKAVNQNLAPELTLWLTPLAAHCT